MNTIVGNHYGKLIINSQICLFIRLPPFELILIGRISHSRLSGKGIYGFFTDKQGLWEKSSCRTSSGEYFSHKPCLF